MSANLDEIAASLEERLPGCVARDAPSADLVTYRVGGPLAVLVRVGSEAALGALADVVGHRGVPLAVVGRGSNLLVADSGFAGLVVLLEGEFELLVIHEHSVRAGGAVPLPVLARRSAAAGRSGLEFYVGIPGSVGGAVRMNAGGHGRETAEVLRRVWIVNVAHGARRREVAVGALGLGYRTSALDPGDVVVTAEFSVSPDAVETCESRIADIVRWRREHQPGGANAGSVFGNPPGDSAGRLIDSCGLKGLRVGGAVVSAKHANFIQADADATAADIGGLIREVRRRVAEASGVELVPELRMLGFAHEVDDTDEEHRVDEAAGGDR